MRDFYVYIVKCNDGSLYTGVTNDYANRVMQRNRGLDPKSYTFRRRPVTLVYVVHFEDVHEAISWEKHIKRWSRKKKEALIIDDEELLKKLAENAYTKRIRLCRLMVRRAHHDNLHK